METALAHQQLKSELDALRVKLHTNEQEAALFQQQLKSELDAARMKQHTNEHLNNYQVHAQLKSQE